MPKVPVLDARVAQQLGLRLRQAREDAGLTQEQAAQAAGISRNHLQVIERGLSDRASRAPFNPHLSVLVGLCEALQVTVSDVVIEVFGPPTTFAVEYATPGGSHPARTGDRPPVVDR